MNAGRLHLTKELESDPNFTHQFHTISQVYLLGGETVVRIANPLPHLIKQTDGMQRRVARFHV